MTTQAVVKTWEGDQLWLPIATAHGLTPQEVSDIHAEYRSACDERQEERDRAARSPEAIARTLEAQSGRCDHCQRIIGPDEARRMVETGYYLDVWCDECTVKECGA